jgi:catechol 2,3-dioxygenase
MKSQSIPHPRPLDPRVGIGHIHLKVADLDRALAFYRDVLGFELTQRYGSQAAFLSAGGYHHHIGLNTWESAGGSPPHPGATGLYHLAIVYPTRTELADALRRLVDAGVPLEGASDHGVSEALYLRDPDGNGVELYWDRPKEQWPRTFDGGLNMVTEPLDLEGLRKEAPDASSAAHGVKGNAALKQTFDKKTNEKGSSYEAKREQR